MNEEPTDAELESLATAIYWHLEHGENSDAVARLRKLIDDAFNRGSDE